MWVRAMVTINVRCKAVGVLAEMLVRMAVGVIVAMTVSVIVGVLMPVDELVAMGTHVARWAYL